MIKLLEKIDFVGEDVFVGMDVHLKSWDISLYHNGHYLKSFTQQPQVEMLVSYLQKNYPNGRYHCAYEAGFCGFWIQRSLQEQGVDCIIVNPADVPQTDKGYRGKTDRTDSKRICRALSAGLLSPIYIPDEETDSHRRLLRHREHLQNDIRRNKTRIKSLLHQMGIIIPEQLAGTGWSNSFSQWLGGQGVSFPALQQTLQSKVALVNLLRKELLQVTKQIKAIADLPLYRPKAERLMTVPGIGILTAATLLFEIIDPNRFRTFVHLNAFVGFCPDEFSSGEQEHRGRITKRRHNRLRSLLVESAWIAVRQDPALTLAYKHYCQRMTAKRAIIRIARKLLNRVWHVWTKQENYENGVVR